MANDAGVAEWLAKTAEFGFCLAVGTPADGGATEALLRRVGYVRETIFGGMWEFTADLTKADTAYTNLELRPHTDGTYSHDAPGVQLLHCMRFDGSGGESTMVDAFAIAERMRRESPAALRGVVDRAGSRSVHRRRLAPDGGAAGVPPRSHRAARAGVVQQLRPSAVPAAARTR